MKAIVMGLLAETPIHTGSGRNHGIVDLPVAREAITDFPTVPGSGMKGALREDVRSGRRDEEKDVSFFGSQDKAGQFSISDASVLLLPARSLTGSYKWITCPLVLERLQRDLQRAGHSIAIPDFEVQANQAMGAKSGQLYLEERQFEEVASADVEQLAKVLQPFVQNEKTRARLAGTLVVLSNDDFAWFARHGLQVQARNDLKEGTKKSINLWFEESVPVDTLMYSLIFAEDEAHTAIQKWFENPYLRVGGNETVGHGWFGVSIVQNGGQ